MRTQQHSIWERTLAKLGLKPLKDPREEVLNTLKEACEDNQILNRHALPIIEGTIKCADMQVHDTMIARSQIKSINTSHTREEILNIVIGSGHSRFPIFDDDNKEVLGILLAKDLINLLLDNNQDTPRFLNAAHNNILSMMRPITKVSENKHLLILLNEFREQRSHMAIAYDQYGDIAGLITIEDVLEEIVGDIEDEHDVITDDRIVKIDDVNFNIKALTTIEAFNEYFNASLSDQECGTIGGLVLQQCTSIPTRGDVIDIDSFQFQIMQADRKRIHLFRLSLTS
ncbi:MAG: transporter associated domain-containing protein [Pseudomonadota bacterium]